MGRGREPRPYKMHERKGNGMNNNVTRRNFLLGSATVAGLAGLAGCSASTSTSSSSSSGFTAPAADKYPIEPDGSDVKAKWTSEQTRDGWYKITQEDGAPTLGVMDDTKIIQVDGYAFKDMNGSGKLDLYEDWRQSIDDRAANLASQLTAEQIFPLTFANATTGGSSTSTDTTDYSLVEDGSRGGVSRLMSSEKSYATDIEWINGCQEVCEKDTDRFGIPYFNFSDPYVLFNVPSSVGLACTFDKDIWRKAGMWQARAWRATGVRIELGPQIDLYSETKGTRLSGSCGGDPALNRDFIASFGAGMQSTWGDDDATDDQGWGDESCAVMLKHFVGEGSNEGGRDDHSDSGKWNVFPGSNFNAHLIPFLDGGFKLDSKTSAALAVMPCYGIAYDPNDSEELGETVGSAYSAHNMSILRNAGWDGWICTDWMILTAIMHGCKDLTEPERWAKLMKNTVGSIGGEWNIDDATAGYKLLVDDMGEDDALALLQDNARRFIKTEMTVDLFEQPYSDRTVAKEVLESETAASFGMEAAEKSVVMLKNAGNVISDKGVDGKVYIPRKFSSTTSFWTGTTTVSVDQCFGAQVEDLGFDVVTDNLGDPTGAAGADGKAQYQESDIQALAAADLADVKYAVVKINNPKDAYQGVQGGPNFMSVVMGTTPDPGPYWKPISLQYRPYTADGANVRKESLNPKDEYGEYINRSYFGESTNATNESDLDFVIGVKEKLPADAKLILIIDADRPMVFSEIEQYADVILFGFESIADEAFAHIIAGSAEPYGLLNHQMPISMESVESDKEDVPRDMECYVDSEGNTYDFCFGLNWSGVIDDDRVKTYKVDPLTAPETEVKTSEEVPVGKVG